MRGGCDTYMAYEMYNYIKSYKIILKLRSVKDLVKLSKDQICP